jgi:triacylglycerol lipase
MSTLAPFLRPQGFVRPHVAGVLREGTFVAEGARYLARCHADRAGRRARPPAVRAPDRSGEPVLLVPGFLAGDGSLSMLARALRAEGFRTYRSHIHVNAGCTLRASTLLEQRIEAIALRRGQRVRIVGHSLGGLLARGLAVRRPDLVSGIVTMGSPMLAPGAHHLALTAGVDALIRLSRAGVPGLMSEECVAGTCAQQSFEESRRPLPVGVAFSAIYSRRDGIVDWRACVDPLAVAIEVTASHLGMAVDPRVRDHVVAALRSDPAGGSALRVTQKWTDA